MRLRSRIWSLMLVSIVLSLGIIQAGAVELYLSGKDVNIPGVVGQIMSESEGNKEEIRTIAAAEKILWFSKPMPDDVMFYAGKWKLIYWAQTNAESGHRIYIRLYVWNGSLNPLAEKYNILDKYDGLKKKMKEIELDSFRLKKGERLVIEINWSKSAGNDLLTLHFNSSNYPARLETPSYYTTSSIPEFSPHGLLAGLVIIIASYGIYRRKNRE